MTYVRSDCMKAMIFASVASMVDLFNRDNIDILMDLGYEVTVACNFNEGSVYSACKKYLSLSCSEISSLQNEDD